MNAAHLHLALNHLPLLGVPFALLTLLYALLTTKPQLRNYSLFLLFIIGLIAPAVFLSGEPAEEIVEHMPGISESLIEDHESLGKLTFILTEGLALVALILLLRFRNVKDWGRQATIAVALLLLPVSALMLLTGKSGGEIRHSEIRSENTQNVHADSHEEEDD